MPSPLPVCICSRCGYTKIDVMFDTLFSTADSPINTSTDDKVNEVKAELLELENNDNERKKNGISEARENYKFDVSSSFVCVTRRVDILYYGIFCFCFKMSTQFTIHKMQRGLIRMTNGLKYI